MNNFFFLKEKYTYLVLTLVLYDIFSSSKRDLRLQKYAQKAGIIMVVIKEKNNNSVNKTWCRRALGGVTKLWYLLFNVDFYNYCIAYYRHQIEFSCTLLPQNNIFRYYYLLHIRSQNREAPKALGPRHVFSSALTPLRRLCFWVNTTIFL